MKNRQLLFDTQAVIDWSKDSVPTRLQETVLAGKVDIFVSAVSPWELILKVHRYSHIGVTYDDFLQTIRLLRAKLLPIEMHHLKTLESLPFIGSHRDPFDRLVISQALAENFTLVGKDRAFKSYQTTKVGSHLQILWQ